MGKNLLISTLGITWEIIPEILGFTNFDYYSLYSKHPKIDEILYQKKLYNIEPVDEIWLITTDSEESLNAETSNFKKIQNWINFLNKKFNITFRYFITKNVFDLFSQSTCKAMTHLIYKVVFSAFKYSPDGKKYLSLAGGRKTMSSDIQQTGFIFGADALLHVILNGFSNKINFMNTPSNSSDIENIMPIVYYGKLESNQIVFRELSKFPILTLPESNSFCKYNDSSDLFDCVRDVISNANNFHFNFLKSLTENETSTNFRSLYGLSPSTIQKLKSLKITDDSLELIKKLPKTDLHCHLGGVLKPDDLIEIALHKDNLKVIMNYKKNSDEFNDFIEEIKLYIKNSDLIKLNKIFVKDNIIKLEKKYNIPLHYLILSLISLFDNNRELLVKIIYGKYNNPKKFSGIGFPAYEKIGDLQGSSLLQTELNIRLTCRKLISNLEEHNVKYFELRCSPINYTKYGLNPIDVIRYICDEFNKSDSLKFSLIIIGSRHRNISSFAQHIELIEQVLKSDFSFSNKISGFDIAGDEAMGKFDVLSALLIPLVEKSFKITIHAGETENVDSIWKAVYRLNADRVGHSLKLLNSKNLIKKFLDRKIAIEMCPSSNYQILNFKDFKYLDSEQKIYPLEEYMKRGLMVTINTDNPGISKTDISNEYLKASNMSPNGLSCWDILQIIKNGFKSAFLPFDDRKKLIISAENIMGTVLSYI